MISTKIPLFSQDLESDIKREYSFLLSIGKDDITAEKAILSYYKDYLENDPDEACIWCSLAYYEWKNGRLSELVKKKAINCLDRIKEYLFQDQKYTLKQQIAIINSINELKETLLSPIPAKTKIRKPKVERCPWRVGSLLAYRIITNEDKLSDHPCFGKYVLLRVVQIKKKPISKTLPTEYYDEWMFVGLYGWIGDEIPSPEIVNELEYIPICVNKLNISKNFDLNILKNALPEIKDIATIFDENVETKVMLSLRGERRNINKVIKEIDYDENFENCCSAFFDLSTRRFTITHFNAFDLTLSNRLSPYLNQ